MAKHEEADQTGRRHDDGTGQGDEQQHADRAGNALREQAEQQVRDREEFRAAEDYAPPAGQGAKVNPDAQRRDPDGEAKPTA